MAHLDLLLRKVEKIHEALGGSRSEGLRAQEKKDKFAVQRIRVEEIIHSIETTQEERDSFSHYKSSEDPVILQLKYKILTSIRAADEELTKLHEVLQKQKKKKNVLLT